jgi:hypothetical protein
LKIGLLWEYDYKKNSVSEELEFAVKYYKAKYFREPTVCFLHPIIIAAMGKDETPILELRPDRSFTPGHLWIGVDE